MSCLVIRGEYFFIGREMDCSGMSVMPGLSGSCVMN